MKEKCGYCKLSKDPDRDSGYIGAARRFMLLIDTTQELKDYGKLLVVSSEHVDGLSHAPPELQDELMEIARKASQVQRRIFYPRDQTISLQEYSCRGAHHLHATVTPVHAERSEMQGKMHKPFLRTLIDSYRELVRAVNLNEGDFERYLEGREGNIHAKLGSGQEGLRGASR